MMDAETTIIKTVEAIMSLVTVYGPIYQGQIIDWIESYFPELYEELEYEDIIECIEILEDQGELTSLLDGRLTFFTQEDVDDFEKITHHFIENIEVEPKVFDREQLLEYNGVSEISLPSVIALKEYLETLTYKKDRTAEDIYHLIIASIFMMADIDQVIKIVQKDIKTKINKKHLNELIQDVEGEIPRGFLKGYSFKEWGALQKELETESLDNELTEIEEGYLEFGEYSYQEVQALARKVKKTNIFENIDSDTPIELLVNGEKVYIQVLGFYNGDRNIIVYGDWEDFLYNYQFVSTTEGVYPDISFRLTYSEIVLDKSEGFATPEVQYQLKKNKYAKMPLLISIDPIESVSLPDQDMLNKMGAVLEQLLIIDREMEQEELFDLCQCMNPYEVVQFHLYKEYMSTGSFVNLCIEDSVIPFVVKSVITIPVEASQERSISIGLYVFIADEKQQYVTLICDNETGMVIAPITLDEEGMEGLLDDIVEVLEKNNILPSEIYTNNGFAATILEPLYEHYDLDVSINGEITDDVYEFFMEQANLDAAKESKH